MEWWRKLEMKVKVIISVITLFSMLSGGGFSVYSTFAKDKEFQELRQEYIEDKLTFRRNRIQDQMWQYQDRRS